MTDIDETLHDYATRWTDDEPEPPDLDATLSRARTSHRARRWPVVVAAACVLAAAVGLAVATTRDDTVHPGAVRSSTVSPPPTAALPGAIAGAARLIATRRIIGRFTIKAVRTTEGAAKNLIDPGSLRPAGRAIWLVQIIGSVAEPAAAALTLEFYNAGQGRTVVGRSLSAEVLDLSRLGPVVDLGLGGSPVPPLSVLRKRALQAARSNGDPHASAQAVLTDYQSAEAASDSGSSNVPNHPAVLIQLHGHFACGTCRIPPGVHGITGRYITLILFAKAPYYATDFGLSNQRADLASLGPVITLLP